MTIRILTVAIKTELDVVAARQRARQIADICGFASQDQVRIATSISELARNVYNYASSGKVHFTIEGETTPQILTIYIEDKGPGITNLEEILAGNYTSLTGMGKGILGAKRLMDRFDIKTGPRGTEIILQKLFPRDAKLITPKMSGNIFAQLSSLPTEATVAEVLHQNQELLHTLAESKARQEDLVQLTRELEDTNRGVVALYAELDEKAEHLRRADAMKSRFLSNMSHEFRTPLSSIRALSKLLLDRVDGDLTIEQEKQVLFILQGALGLTDLVNDLLDLAK
ncbi:MAG: histidine kinase dimerization/phospho-acceptor domain-containing protein, partial [Cellvibrio sp.]